MIIFDSYSAQFSCSNIVSLLLQHITCSLRSVPSSTPTAAKASSPSVSTLPNGLTVVTEDASSTSTVTLTFPNAGSSSESVAEQGAALANKCLAFKSGSGLSSLLILRNLEEDGAAPFATADRHGATVGYTAAPDKAARLVPLLATTCAFEPWDVKDAKTIAGEEAKAANSSVLSVLTEQLYGAAYGAQTAVGRSYYSDAASSSAIKSFREKAYVLNGAVLSATGVADHGAFVRSVEEGLSESAVGEASSAAAAAAYMGGEARISAPVGEAHVALAFEGPKSTALLNVVKQCLTLSGASAFTAPGLVGVYAGVPVASASTVADSLSAAVTAIPTNDVVERAKAMAKAEAVFALDGGSQSLAGAMTSSVLETGSFGGAAQLAASYDAITPKDVAAAYTAMLKSTPSMAAVGDIAAVPYHATVASRFS